MERYADVSTALRIVQRKRDGNGHFVSYKRTTPGKIGVSLHHDCHPDGSICRIYWEAKFRVDGKQRGRRFSVRKGRTPAGGCTPEGVGMPHQKLQIAWHGLWNLHAGEG